MGLFSRKTKAKPVQNEVKAEEKKEIEIPPLPYKHISKHAAADSAAQGSRSDSYEDRTQIALANRQRMANSPYDTSLSNASFVQDIAHNMARGSRSRPASPTAERFGVSRSYSDDAHYHNLHRNSTGPSHKSRAGAQAPKLQRSSTDYFARSPHTHGKQPAEAGYYSYSSDSGYESAEPASAMHSRAPSEHNDFSKGHAAYSNLLPELALNGEHSPVDLNSDARSIRSTRSVSKRTRFEDSVDPMPALDQLQQYRQDSDSSLGLTSHHEGSSPPLSILEGFKVNKKGKILNEEGEPIGELVEGDLLDCVRQKVNANGEVLDEYSRIVGHARTIATPTTTQQNVLPATETGTPIAQASPVLTRPQSVQQPVEVTKSVEEPVQSEPVAAAVPAQEVQRSDSAGETWLPAVTHQVMPQSNAVPVLSLPTPEPARVARSASERSLSELSKSYVRPAMRSVPENKVPIDDAFPASPSSYSYKGEIPATDGPSAAGKLLLGPSSYAKLALVGGHSASTLFPPTRPVGISSRRSTSHIGTSSSANRLPLQSAMKKRSQYDYTFDFTPSDSGSEAPSSDDGRMLTLGGHSRSASMHTTGSMSRPRTYFTHAGKVTIDPDDLAPSKGKQSATAAAAAAAAAAPPPPPPVPAVPTAESLDEKKKGNRKSFLSRRKSKTAAAA
ncbi:uncharacterized protein SEPMUDRAFT_148594 [Sphaerulina musiva SO2202]|uniref:Uncharacterized protein n=1 Tax=Sphaerulina musiva (strain SO2202) TaxID=692275 RepID=M3D4U5_SPHMS|nr:uncharacterized protein SEPMUDRAFT_148594 [Sphaerulina musiva SO2202]EMF13225.1 hypothetical protein SEPMUDRAFT_148594 [Sphaerulina musiva SO2202]